jgi:CDP-diacylglycerol--glycerol-3-phosphate 3-phosphatidyltransferase
MFTQKFQAWVRKWAERLVGVFRDSPLTPNMLTLFGLVITAAGAAVLGLGQLFIAGVILLFAGLFDIFDGALARASGKVYRYGAFLDSTVDRYSEGLIYLGLLVFFRGKTLQTVLVLLALAGSFLVSYVRARAQSLGFKCEVGVLARPERVVIIVAGLLLDPILPIGGYHLVLTLALVVLAVGTNFTAVQRVFVVWQQNREELREQRRRSLAATKDSAGTPTPTRPAKRRFFETP